ncbi:MAG: bifunctional oligoribonuclease/PAP phosphatase NrnA [Candidatus Omnitrophota bacterium]
MSLEKISAEIRKHKTFLITSHMNPEGDALSSELAFYRLLDALGKKAVIVNADDTPVQYGFLPWSEKIRKFNHKVKGLRFECFVVLDCSDLSRCGEVASLSRAGVPVVNIDHHISNQMFGAVNWVEPFISSASEMVYQLYKGLGLSLDKKTALLLYTGILTDTGSFRYSNTRPSTHQAAADLIGHGLDIPQIYKYAYENISLADVRLLNKILSTTRCRFDGKVAWAEIPRALLKEQHLFFDVGEYVLSILRGIKGVEVAVLFKENMGNKNEIRINLRSQGKINVNKIAAIFGGGGHKTASGCTVVGSIGKVKSLVLNKIGKIIQ